MRAWVENMKEYVENMKKYVENIKEYEEICRYIGFLPRCKSQGHLFKFAFPLLPLPRVTARTSLHSVFCQGPPQTLVPLRATAVSLQGGLVPEIIYEGRDSFIFLIHFFEFFRYSFMFPTYFFMFFTYFPHIPSYFRHIPSYFSHIPSWGHVIDLQQEYFKHFPSP